MNTMLTATVPDRVQDPGAADPRFMVDPGSGSP